MCGEKPKGKIPNGPVSQLKHPDTPYLCKRRYRFFEEVVDGGNAQHGIWDRNTNITLSLDDPNSTYIIRWDTYIRPDQVILRNHETGEQLVDTGFRKTRTKGQYSVQGPAQIDLIINANEKGDTVYDCRSPVHIHLSDVHETEGFVRHILVAQFFKNFP